MSLKYLKLYKNSIGANHINLVTQNEMALSIGIVLLWVLMTINLYLKNFDKYSVLYRDWNQAGIKLKKTKIIFFSLNKNNRIVPTIGANGSIFRSNILKNLSKTKNIFLMLISLYMN